jgi:magnesium transporter
MNITHNRPEIVKFKDCIELEQIIKEYNLPPSTITGFETPEVFPRTRDFKNLGSEACYSISLCNLIMTHHDSNIELDPLVIYADHGELVFLIHVNSDTDKELDELIAAQPFKSNQALIARFLLRVYANYRIKLGEIKAELDDLEEQSTRTTENRELIRLKNLNKATVLLEHTLETQHHALENLFELSEFADNLRNHSVIDEIKTAERQITKLVEVYRDLIDAIGGLFSDIMSNHLNHLMKYLDSASLVISVPSMIAGLWGMNTGGLPGRSSSMGFWWMLFISGGLALAMWFWLRFKKYND